MAIMLYGSIYTLQPKSTVNGIPTIKLMSGRGEYTYIS